MAQICNKHLKRAIELARRLVILADEGEAVSKDDGCIVLYGIVRDSAYRIRDRARKELEFHRSLDPEDDVVSVNDNSKQEEAL